MTCSTQEVWLKQRKNPQLWHWLPIILSAPVAVAYLDPNGRQTKLPNKDDAIVFFFFNHVPFAELLFPACKTV